MSRPSRISPAALQERQYGPSPNRALLIAGIVLIGLNLRPALASVGPLVHDIRAATGLSNAALGLLTTLPLLGFGFVSMLTSLVTRRIGYERTLALALFALAAGLLLRVAPSTIFLFGGTAMVGVAIAFGNVLLPALVKRDFPHRTGFMTSVYSSAMGLGATVAAGTSVPLALSLGWPGSLGAWALPATAALLVWLPQIRFRTLPQHDAGFRRAMADLGRSPLAWQVAVFMGLQSLTFYVILAWLPEILQFRGLKPEPAGFLLALSQASGIAGTMLVPTLAARRRDQRKIVWWLASLELAALIGLLAPSTTSVGVWVALIGFVLGGTFGLSLLLIVMRSTTAQTATELSGMAQSVGYLLAATGPTLFGYLYDVMGGWSGPLVFLIGLVGAKVIAGLGAARDRMVGQ